ncbi:hypothetical protein POSPLADRAFT_1073160 [Postia placenta MAD-698-R-SB12]|uniref:PhoD-like phosphatase metallophosphatase domain-containing protein n=1 Tax=Postia placenta MAD-698-R-SB12 TaxID=670580 RepID=A0A1X6N7Z9_9APHY|nr:hypothetical protein POSPLADRAFT_1073160 [Postia placenta MAD-698-R-SB12]OSX64704.1 hypothetical protein POSPLADRAFT_1073160 [Postia placenta MAD-698-R-SB12]
MKVLESAQALVSTLFRLVAYIFLQVIPHHLGKTSLPPLYLLYLLLAFIQPPVDLVPPKATLTKHTNGNGESHETDKDEKVFKDTTPTRTIPSSDRAPSYGPLSVLLLTLPTRSRALRVANLAINTLIFAAAVEFVAYPFFDDAADVVYTRIGAMYPDATKLVVRYPGDSAAHREVRVLWRQADAADSWNNGPVANLTSESDWVATVRLDGLWPSTSYEYQFQDTNGTLLPYPSRPIRFRTFPDPQLNSGSYFRFLASSCLTPNFPYLPLQGRRIKGFDLVAEHIWPAEKQSVPLPEVTSVNPAPPAADESSSTSASVSTVPESASSSANEFATTPVSRASSVTKAPTEFMIFLGDFIYADVPIYYGDDKETYRRLYRRNYQSDSFRKVYERLPFFHAYDDHEIINNYAGNSNDSAPPFANANEAFQLYNAQANYDSPVEGQHYYEFRHGDTAFFVMDTRRYRSVVEETDEASRTMLGEKQLATLYDWLGRVNNTATFKFIVSSVPFTSLWTYEALTDSWAAFTHEKAALLRALHTVPNVIVLSGDRHEFAAIEFTGEAAAHTVLEISTSPLSMFYVPIVRTLNMASVDTVNRTTQVVQQGENGTVEVTEVVEQVPQERVLRYIADGNYKWSSIEVDTRDQDHPVVNVDIMINGACAYNLTVHGQPVKLRSATALGAYVPQSFKGVLDKFGLKPSRWF